MVRNDRITHGGFLERWAHFAARRRGRVVLAWIAAFVALILLARVAGGSFSNSFSLPGTESQRAADLLRRRFPQQAGDSATLVFQSPRALTDPSTRAVVDGTLSAAAALEGVVAVGSPYASHGDGGLSADQTVGYADIRYNRRASDLTRADVQPLLDLVKRSTGAGLTVEVGGPVAAQAEAGGVESAELIGLACSALILLLAFGSVVAMGLPLVTALIGLGGSIAAIGLSAHVLALPGFTTQFAALIGLGVGIDYALLVVTRFREGLHGGLEVEESVVLAVTTAGRSVLFAGTVVALALLGLNAIGIPWVGALGDSGALIVAVAVLVALTLLPSVLAFAGHRVDRWSSPLGRVSLGGGRREGYWYRFAARIQAHPLPWFGAALVLLLLLAAPAVRLRLGSADAGNDPATLHTRRAYDLLAAGFGPGFNGPLVAVLDLQHAGPSAQAVEAKVEKALAAQPGVAQVSPPLTNAAGDAAVIAVTPATAPQDQATTALVHALRSRTLPAAVAGTSVQAMLTGPTAADIDVGDRAAGHLPLFFATVIGLSVLVLVAVFRSLAVALKAGLMNLLSIGASFGVLVAIFQWGWLSGIVGVKRGPIESYLPMFLFAILFGLSMDYEVFLISRVREEYTRTRDNSGAVAHGLAVTGRVITAAAAIMVSVFVSFALGDQRLVKEFGIGMAVAVLVDATVVRLVLVPATMELLGSANWWLPAWLERLLPPFDVEGPAPRPLSADRPVAADTGNPRDARSEQVENAMPILPLVR